MEKLFLSSRRIVKIVCKALLISLMIIFFGVTLSAQTHLHFHEIFEVPGFGDSVVSSQATPGIDDWGFTFSHASTGLSCDCCSVRTGTTTVLETLPFSTFGSQTVKFSFDQICKIDIQDNAKIWISIDGGITWVQLIGSDYLGISQFAANGNKFASNSYGYLWQPGSPTTIPLNSWWKTEVFDISNIAQYQLDVRIRFTLEDGGTPGSGGNFGWLIDNIMVTGTNVFSLDPGIKTLIAPYYMINCGVSSSMVCVTIENFGSNLASDIPVNYTFGNSPPVTGIYLGTIAAGNTANYCFPVLISIPPFYTDTTIILTIWTSLPGDQNPGNNVRMFLINIIHTPPAPQIPAVTIPTGNPAILTVNFPDPVKWYDAFVGGNMLGVGNTFVTPVLNTTTVYYPQATSLAGCVGQRARDTVFVTNDFASITGTVTYKNAASTPMNNTSLQLFNGPILVRQTATNDQGQYIFNNLPAGNYHIVASTIKPWGGGNALDALFIMKNFIGLAPLNGLFLEAADVDASGATNAVDALLTLQRFTGTVTQFAAGDWLFETSNIVVPMNTNVVQNIQALCFGDVNGSYIPQ